ncbi:hypothetical protein [Antarcticimicrobium sediminis]|uniref:Uncharacterized protein n=1 Tax=Antarcticimicrobium sediminis TaxID=2546227 RepID=A0A4R5EHY6_9RHOB|nr:hypothetical protein [Antarcticimicrobium sediminis]TDE34131.1 hypothetical protein E1B25_20290 [Antarcticimicrobium sediminis]
MAQPKKKWVAFRTNATVPAEVMGEEVDQKMQVGEPVLLPASYADHVVHDRFADFCKAPKKSAPKKVGGSPSPEEDAAAEAAAKLDAAQARVDDLNDKMSDMSEGDDGWSELSEQLDEAVTELAALQPAS